MRRAFEALDRLIGHRAAAHLGSLALSVRSRARCAVRFDDPHWIHRYRDGTVVDAAFVALSPADQDRITRDIYLYGYEPRSGDTVLDLGAGAGGETRLLSRLVGDRGRVVAVEAHPGTFDCLRQTVRLNGLTNVTLHQCAVTASSGPHHIEDNLVSSVANGLTTDATDGVRVDGRRLGDLVGSLPVERVALVKMNIEGAESPVLTASFDALAAVDNLVVCCHDHKADLAPLYLPGWVDTGALRTFGPVTELLRRAGFAIRTRPGDSRPWVRDTIYASRSRRDR